MSPSIRREKRAEASYWRDKKFATFYCGAAARAAKRNKARSRLPDRRARPTRKRERLYLRGPERVAHARKLMARMKRIRYCLIEKSRSRSYIRRQGVWSRNQYIIPCVSAGASVEASASERVHCIADFPLPWFRLLAPARIFQPFSLLLYLYAFELLLLRGRARNEVALERNAKTHPIFMRSLFALPKRSRAAFI